MRPQRSITGTGTGTGGSNAGSAGRGGQASADEAQPARVLVVDDDAPLGRAYERILRAAGFVVERAADGALAAAAVKGGSFDVVLSDIDMPGLSGIDLLRAVRAHDLDLPVVLVTASPAVETAVAALEYGALRYLIKPVAARDLVQVITRAAQLRKLAVLNRQALMLREADRFGNGDRAGIEALFARALDGLYMAYQPIVCHSERRVHALEALVRSSEPAMAGPGPIFDAAARLDRLDDLGRCIRAKVAGAADGFPDFALFVNLHPHDLLDEQLYSLSAQLSAVAGRVVL
ncbi:MAG: diguanylate cyclase/phosphodiesterase [bacterium]|nr:diguanylate cyclase/phosphodiesterase [bacterium]